MNSILGENDIQGACQGALQAYFRDRRKKYTQFAPYSNQQSADSEGRRNLFAADVLGIIANSSLVMLEMKYHDVLNGILPRFDKDQHEQLVRLQDTGVPVQYCYNNESVLEYFVQADDQWPKITLRQLNVSPPRKLAGHRPLTPDHISLLGWIRSIEKEPSGRDNFSTFASLLNGVLRPGQVRNQILVLVYSNGLKHMVGMDESGLKQFAHWIVSNPTATAPNVAQFADKIRIGLDTKVQERILLEAALSNQGTSRELDDGPTEDRGDSFSPM